MVLPNQKLDATLRRIVDEHGLGSVLEALGKIASSDALANTSPADGGKAKPRRRKVKPKPTAPTYVAKMDLPADSRQAIADLADRFERKDFLPSFGSVAHFCAAYEIDAPASKTRASAIPRVFKFIAGLDAAEIQKISDSGMFAGPSRLAPIADAIRNKRQSGARQIPRSHAPGLREHK